MSAKKSVDEPSKTVKPGGGTESLPDKTRAGPAEAKRLKFTLETVLDTAYEGIVVIDESCRITMFNKAYGDFLGLDPLDVVGKDIREVIENTRMHVVLKTGVPELRKLQRIKGHDMLCDRIPIKEGGKIVGAVGKVLFRDVSELENLLVETRKLKNQLEYYRDELKRQNGTRYSLDSIVGISPSLKGLKDLCRRVARSGTTVLLGGESGTGKELFAHAIHNLSARAAKPFVKVNCAALPENLLESELFGYSEGAFTGAKKGGKIGKFELADGGTILLDEIGELDQAMQVKLLRVLQEREIERLGDNRPVPVDVRVIAATNRDLQSMVEGQSFRADLFYRLNVITMEVPPLRDRKTDIIPLAKHFLAKHCQTAGFAEKSLSGETLEILENYRWPGNARELENVLERAVTVSEGDVITPAHIPVLMRVKDKKASSPKTLKQIMAESEAEQLKHALRQACGNAVEAAHALGIGKTSMYDKMAKYGIHSRDALSG